MFHFFWRLSFLTLLFCTLIAAGAPLEAGCAWWGGGREVLQSNRHNLPPPTMPVRVLKDRGRETLYEVGYFERSSRGKFLSPIFADATYIGNPFGRTVRIRAVNFEFLERPKKKWCPLTLRFHGLDSIKLRPGSPLPGKSLTLDSSQYKKRMRVDVSSLDLHLPEEGIYILLQSVQSEEEVASCCRQPPLRQSASLDRNALWYEGCDTVWLPVIADPELYYALGVSVEVEVEVEEEEMP